MVLTKDQLARVLKDREWWGRAEPLQARQWIDQLYLDVLDLKKEGEASLRWSTFFVHLTQALVELPPYYEKLTKTIAMFPEFILADEVDDVTPPAQRACALLEEIRASLSDKELIYVANRRHCACHVFQTHYCLQINSKGELVETRAEPLLEGRRLPREGLRDLLREIIEEHGVNEQAIAVKIAATIEEKVLALREAVYDVTEALRRWR